MKQKKRSWGWQKVFAFAMALCLACSLSACGGTREEKERNSSDSFQVAPEDGDNVYADVDVDEDDETVSDGEGAGSNTAKKAATADEDTTESGAESGAEEKQTDQNKEGNQSAEKQTVSREMLVYRGTITIDTLQFDQSVEEFKKLLNQVGGFVEKENYTDDGERWDDYYAVEEDEKHNSYTATIRVPSAEYDTVMDGAGNLGDVRSKTSNVQNVTQQYGTYQSQIKIYEAEYQRYLKLLEKASEDEYALEIEQKLFDLQVKIAEIKSSITNLETDVAYSYIDLTLTEVKKYQERPEKKKTSSFLDRLVQTCKNSWNVFLFLIEKVLFCIIYTWYYIAVILLLLFVIFKVQRKNPQSRVRVKRNDVVPDIEEDFEEEEPDSDEEEPGEEE